MADDPLRDGDAQAFPPPATSALSAVVYAERGGEILLLQRAEGTALAGQWFLPGGLVEPGELPEEGARRELAEESGLAIDGSLELVGAYPMHVYGHDVLQLSYRGTVADAGEVVLSHEHLGVRWVEPASMRAVLTDEAIRAIAGDDDRIRSLLAHIRTDLERYLARVGR